MNDGVYIMQMNNQRWFDSSWSVCGFFSSAACALNCSNVSLLLSMNIKVPWKVTRGTRLRGLVLLLMGPKSAPPASDSFPGHMPVKTGFCLFADHCIPRAFFTEGIGW